jgi:hypothetical protein
MDKVAFIIKGQTFLKSMAPLIYFSNKCGIEPYVIVYKTRKGKEYDSARSDAIESALAGSPIGYCVVVEDEAHAHSVLKEHGLKNIVCQEAQHHFKSFCTDDYNVFSIAVFTDSLHYAHDFGKDSAGLKIRKLYFASDLLIKEFRRLGCESWDCEALGSPHFDHHLFIPDSGKKTTDRKAVLFLTPPTKAINSEIIAEIAALEEKLNAVGIDFIIKDRKKAPWPGADKGISGAFNRIPENGFPYTSLAILSIAACHITAFGTSAFESIHLNKSFVNLPVTAAKTGNRMVSEYNLDEIYEHDLAVKYSGNLFDDVMKSIKLTEQATPRIADINDLASTKILIDIKKCLAQ